MVFDFRKLRGRIVEKFGTLRNFAFAMDQTEVNISFKMNNLRPWTSNDIKTAALLLDIPDEEIGIYFFKTKV